MNRETNFNKVFNSTPNVGVLNPLSAGSKVSYSLVILCQGLSEPEFYGDLVYKLKKIVQRSSLK